MSLRRKRVLKHHFHLVGYAQHSTDFAKCTDPYHATHCGLETYCRLDKVWPCSKIRLQVEYYLSKVQAY